MSKIIAKGMGVNGASRAEYPIARDEEEALIALAIVRRQNRKARSESRKGRNARPVWKPGGPLPPKTQS